MITHTVKNNETIFDIALQYSGNIDGVFDIQQVNDFEVLQNALIAGQQLTIPDTFGTQNKQVTAYLNDKKINLATK
jgi:alpha-galactosidase